MRRSLSLRLERSGGLAFPLLDLERAVATELQGLERYLLESLAVFVCLRRNAFFVQGGLFNDGFVLRPRSFADMAGYVTSHLLNTGVEGIGALRPIAVAATLRQAGSGDEILASLVSKLSITRETDSYLLSSLSEVLEPPVPAPVLSDAHCNPQVLASACVDPPPALSDQWVSGCVGSIWKALRERGTPVPVAGSGTATDLYSEIPLEKEVISALVDRCLVSGYLIPGAASRKAAEACVRWRLEIIARFFESYNEMSEKKA